jgi:predicted phosphodiesterase
MSRVDTNDYARFEYGLDKPLMLRGDWAVTADWHVPLYDAKLVNKFLDDAANRGLSNLLIAGDFLNGDSLSQYYPKQKSAGIEKEIEEARSIMSTLAKNFKQIVLVKGNHDYRYVKSVEFRKDFVTAMREVFDDIPMYESRLKITNLDHVYLNSNGQKYFIAHPTSYSKNPLNNPLAIAVVKKCHVLTAHTHHCAMGWDASGEYVVGELGGFFNIAQTEYLQGTTTYPNWCNGYWFIQRGKPEMVSYGARNMRIGSKAV